MIAPRSKHPEDLDGAVVADHRQLTAAFDEVDGQSASKRQAMLEHITTLLVAHMVGEEQFLYPVTRKMLANGEEVAGEKLFEHSDTEHLLRRIEKIEPESAEFEKSTTSLFTDIQVHMDNEEREVLPAIRELCNDHQRRGLGDKFLRAKRMAPVRPHPSAPDSPPANKIVDPGARLVDRVRLVLTSNTKFNDYRP